MRPDPDPVGPGQESVWTYPRPAIAEATTRHLVVRHRGVTIADTRAAVRTLETGHPPSYYFPPADVAMALLRPTAHRSLCEWKGQARYFDVHVGGETIAEAAWSYGDPTPGFASLRGHVAFYPHLFDTCLVDGERAQAQPGGFYGGWVTSDLAGPFKGGPGSRFW
ncbi:DUF427 domain-containing protein [Sphingomonas sp.]|uniref:DUF427 domain-containing protein n=1 Tax=Sphingomonas sp. TaxID=28214 RepID=UPI002C3C6192|nr:DUF427 domain-containing protein [Sphingomonas sp.]HTG39362.1 DUF427 domain-containing protein [Sphingomonas sp.]